MIKESLMNKDFHLTKLTISGKQVKIYDNCLPLDLFKTMQGILLGPSDFTWSYNDLVISKKYNGKKQLIDSYDDDDMFQFTHLFFTNAVLFDWTHTTEIIYPILSIINARAWLKIKANLGTKDPEHMIGGWHQDLEGLSNIITAQLYMNTNNGYTLMESGDKIESVENRLVVFPCDILHTGISQTDTKVRVLLNFNFFS